MDYKTFINDIAPDQVTPYPLLITTTFLYYLIPGLLLAVHTSRIHPYPEKVAW